LFKRLYISTLLIFGLCNAEAQNGDLYPSEIALLELQESLHLFLSKDVTSGTRVFILSPERDESVPSIYRSRVEGVIVSALAQTKFDIVFQPFLKEETIKRVESTDSTFKVSNQSSYKLDYGSMRTLLDSMKEYSIDLLLASHLYLSNQHSLILDVWLIDSKTLELKQTYRVYSAIIENRLRDKAEVQISAFHGTATESYISREYGNSQALTIGPDLEQIFVDGARLSIIQPILRSSNVMKGGVSLGIENSYLKNFTDNVYGINEFQIRSISLGALLQFALVSNNKGRELVSLQFHGGLTKTSIFNTAYSVGTSANIRLTDWFSVFAMSQWNTELAIQDPFKQNINYQTPQLCGGISIHI